MAQISQERETFRIIARHLTNSGIARAVSEAVENSSGIDLDKELHTLSKCIDKANILINSWGNGDLHGVQNSWKILKEHGLNNIPSPFTDGQNPQKWLRSLAETIEVGNREAGPAGDVYKDPQKILNGDPLSVFRWYLYDGCGRMVAIHLGISNEDKQQEQVGDWIGCALTEAAVVLAEEGDKGAKEVVKNMLDMGFIASGWILSDQVVERAKKL